MKKTSFLTLFIYMLLIAVATIGCVACSTDASDETTTQGAVDSVRTISFICTFADGTKEARTIITSNQYLREALEEEGLISGDESEFGLYVKTVCGETLEYATDGKYWALYVGGEYGMTGVDDTPVVDGETYEFRAE